MALTLRNNNKYKKNQRSSLLLSSSSWKFLLVFIFVKAAAANDPIPLPLKQNQSYQTDRFDTSVSFRQNICSLVQKYDNNNANISRALEGFEIRAALGCPSDFCQTINLTETDDGTSSSILALDSDNPGLYGVLLDELAKRAGFTWRDSFVFSRSDNLNENKDDKTFTDLVIWDIETYDLSVNWWAETTERMTAGVDFPEGWYDSGIIMLAKKSHNSESGSKFILFGWFQPFTLWVWVMIGVTIISSGLVYFLLEKIDERSDKRALDKDPVENIFLAGVAFTTHFEFNPRTKAAMLFTLSVSFWAMLTASAYTANLASFLVVKNTPGLQITSLEDAVAYGYQICVYNNSAIDDILTKDFKNRINLVLKPTEASTLQGVLAGECDIAAIAADTWRTQKLNQTLTTKSGGGRLCDQLEWVGRKYKEIPAGFATRRDVGRKCSSLISDVIDIHMRDMIEVGFVKGAWEAHLASTFGQPSCVAKTSMTTEDENLRLNMKNMGGIFLLHFVIMGLVLAVTLYNRLSGRIKARNERLRKEEQANFLKKMKENKDFRSCLAVAKNTQNTGSRNLHSVPSEHVEKNPLEGGETSIQLERFHHSDYESSLDDLVDFRDSAIIKATTASYEENYAASAVQESIDELRKMQHIQSQSILEIKQHLLQIVNQLQKRDNTTD